MTFWQAVPLVTALLSLVVIYATAWFGIRNKQADLITHFHTQFDVLQEKRAELLSAKADDVWSPQRMATEAEIFFDRFWSLQFDQFVAWHEGYVPTSLYVYWVFSRWRELHQPSDGWTLGGLTLASTLEGLRNRWQNTPDRSSRLSTHVTKFLCLMHDLKQNAASADVHALLRTSGPSRATRLARRLFGAY